MAEIPEKYNSEEFKRFRKFMMEAIGLMTLSLIIDKNNPKEARMLYEEGDKAFKEIMKKLGYKPIKK